MLLFLFGPDTYRSHRKAREIIETFQKIHNSSLNLAELDCARAELADLKGILQTVSMFPEKKLVVLHNPFSNAQFTEASAEFKKLLEQASKDIVVFVQEGPCKKTTALFKFLQKNARVQEFALLGGARLIAWIQKEFQQYDVTISKILAEQLARGVGSDLWQLSNEIKKLAAFQKSSGKLKASDIHMLVRTNAEGDIFATIDAIAQKNKKQALGLLYRHLQKGDSPYYLFTMLTYQFRTIERSCRSKTWGKGKFHIPP